MYAKEISIIKGGELTLMSTLKENWESARVMEWHRRQFLEPKRNLIFFDKFISNFQNFKGGCKILDLACGGGAEAVWLATQHPAISIKGLDYVEKAFSYFEENAAPEIKKRVSLEKGDWYAIDRKYINQFDGIISLETLSWLEDWKEPIDKIIELNPKWMAFSALFYEGKINYQVKLENYEDAEMEDSQYTTYYNIYSIPLIKEYMVSKGYKKFEFQKFDIDIDLPKPERMGTGTYTVKTVDGERLQISAAMLMPWYFIYAEKA